MKYRIKKYLIVFAVPIVAMTACIKDPDIHPNTSQGNFDALWEIIDTRYCYLDYKDIDWDGIYNVYKDSLEEAGSNKYKLFDLMGKMLAELKDGHVNLYSDFDVSRYQKWYTDSSRNYYSSIVYSDDYLGSNYRIAGGLRYGILKGEKFNTADIGYIYYGSFSDGFSAKNIQNILFDYFKNCQGIIIDVRDNGGGTLTYAEELASYFFKEDAVTGYMAYKSGSGHSDFSEPTPVKTIANANHYCEKPVAVLTNRLSYSATNDFVVRMKQAPNAFTVGSWTGGGGGMPLSSELPNGWMVRFSACPMFDADMNHTELGVPPDYHVVISDEDRMENKDAVIDEAIQLLYELIRK